MKLTADKVKAIAEELRITRYKETKKMAFEYIYDKYKNLFEEIGGYTKFLELMDICSVFFSSQGKEKLDEIRSKTVFRYV